MDFISYNNFPGYLLHHVSKIQGIGFRVSESVPRIRHPEAHLINALCEAEEWRCNFLGDVGACDKIVIPCYSSEDLHWFWPFWTGTINKLRFGIHCLITGVDIAGVLLPWIRCAVMRVSVLAKLLASDLELAYDDGLNLNAFKVVHKKDIPTQGNGNDCGIFAIKFMWAAATGNTVDSKFDSEEARFFLGLELVRSKINNVRQGAMNAAYNHSKDVMSRNSMHELSTTTEKVTASSVLDPKPGAQNLAYATKKKRALRWGCRG
ncbi:hypothetical protein L484_020481 [Morus notabilis]|uniref:Ubiquitin-like protease family profile domain-containing protein n=1 Tax=Morus notabilis TaxID=981085 RepID=W9SJF3_9ROSA|nr:hypothetical protein L484_020481 [Morus notabilis]